MLKVEVAKGESRVSRKNEYSRLADNDNDWRNSKPDSIRGGQRGRGGDRRFGGRDGDRDRSSGDRRFGGDRSDRGGRFGGDRSDRGGRFGDRSRFGGDRPSGFGRFRESSSSNTTQEDAIYLDSNPFGDSAPVETKNKE